MTRSSPSRGAWLAAVAVLAALVVGLLIGGREVARSGQHRAAGPLPSALAPSKSAAVRTAVAYVMALRWDVLVDDQRRRAVVDKFAAADSADDLDADLAPNVQPVKAAASVAPVVARRALIGVRVDRFAPPAATVSLWGFALFATGAYGPATQWSTSRLDLNWEQGEWRVAAVTSRGGPSPESPLHALARADASFEEIRHAP